MNLTGRALALTAAVMMLSPAALAQSRHTEHTFMLDDPQHRPAATLEDVAWLVGAWRGEGFGSTFEEVWNPPSAGSMVGMFKLLDGDAVAFYELLLLVEEAGSITMKVRHFDPDFTSWEEKDDYGQFRFIRAEPDAVHFSSLSFYRIDDSTVHAYLAANFGDGLREQKLIYRRRD